MPAVPEINEVGCCEGVVKILREFESKKLPCADYYIHIAREIKIYIEEEDC